MRKITLFILTIFTVATLHAAARPSLDGRAVVADSGTMPRGLFARTVGYLPGDSVTVTNPATGSTIDVLVLGAIDPSEGVAILLSPESADALRIRPDSNVQVKLTKRAGSLDENANGSAVLSEDEPEPEEETPAPESYGDDSPAEPDDEEYEEYAAVPESEETAEEIPAVAERREEPVRPAAPKETLYEEVPPLPKDGVRAERAAAATPADDDLQKVVLIEGSEEIKVTPDAELVGEEIPVTPENEPAEVEELAKVEDDISKAGEEIPVTPDDEPAEVEVIAEAEEPAQSRLQQVIVVETERAVAADEEPLQPVIEELPVYVEESRVAAEELEELPYGIETEPEVELAYSENMPYSEEEIDAYQPIVLVPTDANPPAHDDYYDEPPAAVAESMEESASAPVAEAPAPAVEEEPRAVVSNDWSNYVVPSLRNLRAGSYYVQVATLSSEENVRSFVERYTSKYPVVLVPNSSKTAYQVMVGPLNIDEYGSVDEKFKAYGFKDSFVRKIH